MQSSILIGYWTHAVCVVTSDVIKASFFKAEAGVRQNCQDRGEAKAEAAIPKP